MTYDAVLGRAKETHVHGLLIKMFYIKYVPWNVFGRS
jgi:hypothetical protein